MSLGKKCNVYYLLFDTISMAFGNNLYVFTQICRPMRNPVLGLSGRCPIVVGTKYNNNILISYHRLKFTYHLLAIMLIMIGVWGKVDTKDVDALISRWRLLAILYSVEC
ncbi:hypothetical protein QTP88_004749 [Uroleucon formosanum]